MFRLIGQEPEPGSVRRVTLVPFLPDGRCVLIGGPAGPALPAGEVLDGEDCLIDTVLRVPLETAGFRYQHVQPFGVDGDHLYAWIEGAPYRGDQAHSDAELTFVTADEAAHQLEDRGEPMLAAAVRTGAASYFSLDDRAYYAGNLRTLARAYLRGRTPQAGSGFGGDERAWRQGRHHITEAVCHSGTFLDVGCANGLLMESVAAWCAERGLAVEPYGIDLAPELVELARRRLPHWAGRIWTGNAIDWRPPNGQRFDYVHVLIDCVPRRRYADLVRHHLTDTVRPGGRLLISNYGADTEIGSPPAAQILRALGVRCHGQTSGDSREGRSSSPTAWIDVPA